MKKLTRQERAARRAQHRARRRAVRAVARAMRAECARLETARMVAIHEGNFETFQRSLTIPLPTEPVGGPYATQAELEAAGSR